MSKGPHETSSEIHPFDQSGVLRSSDGILRYQEIAATLTEMIQRSVEEYRDSEALVELGGSRITFGELWDRSTACAGGLVQKGLKRGDRVTLTLGAGVDWVVGFLGVIFAGGIVVPVNTRLTEKEVEFVISDSDAKFAIDTKEDLVGNTHYVYQDALPTDPAAIFYTSGTTGFPKGAVLSHENFVATVENCRRAAGLEKGGMRSLISVPLFHVTGCNSQLMPALGLGGTSVIMPGLDLNLFFQAMRQESINLLLSVPAIYWLVLNTPEFSSLEVGGVSWVLYGGAPTPPNLVKAIRKAFPNAKLGNGFGLTESSALATFLPDHYATLRPETVGFAVPVVDAAIFEPDPDSSIGELMLRGQSVSQSYWNNPVASERTFVDGWCMTGDMARIDPEGFVTIVDRKKDMVNRGGENVYSVEVENAISALPGVFEVAVVPVPDEVMGEKVGAIIFPVPGVELDPYQVAEGLRGVIADYKIPEYIAVSKEPLPRNPGGKILKGKFKGKTDWSRVRLRSK